MIFAETTAFAFTLRKVIPRRSDREIRAPAMKACNHSLKYERQTYDDTATTTTKAPKNRWAGFMLFNQ